MGKKYTQKELDEVYALHLLWLTGQGGSPANFENADLSGLDFSHKCFNNTNFLGANCTGANFYAANLFNTNFLAANLNNVDFRNAKIQESNFDFTTNHGTNYQNASFKNTSYKDSGVFFIEADEWSGYSDGVFLWVGCVQNPLATVQSDYLEIGRSMGFSDEKSERLMAAVNACIAAGHYAK